MASMNVTVIQTDPTRHQSGQVRVHVELSTGWATVGASGPRWAFGSMQPAHVSWSSVGAKSPDDAALYAAAICTAATLAVKLEASHHDQAAAKAATTKHYPDCCCQDCRGIEG